MIKAREIPTLYFLDSAHPRPCNLEWINRGTDQVLRQTTVDMLLRTLNRPTDTPSVKRLHDNSGLRLSFNSEGERQRFVIAFENARKKAEQERKDIVAALFDQRKRAEKAALALEETGVPRSALSMVWRTSALLDPDYAAKSGHSAGSVAGAVAGGGVGGALFGVAVLFVPGVGGVAAAGAILASVAPSVAAVGGIIGATGGAIAKMLTDHDVDSPSASYYDQEIRRGKVFLSADTTRAAIARVTIEKVMIEHGGVLREAA